MLKPLKISVCTNLVRMIIFLRSQLYDLSRPSYEVPDFWRLSSYHSRPEIFAVRYIHVPRENQSEPKAEGLNESTPYRERPLKGKQSKLLKDWKQHAQNWVDHGKRADASANSESRSLPGSAC